MSITNRAVLVADVTAAWLSQSLTINVHAEGDRCVVYATGELDSAGRDHLLSAATAGNHAAMVIDLSAVSFMDCSGYGSLVACRLDLDRHNRTLEVRGLTGQPARLIERITTIQRAGSAAREANQTGR